MKNLSKIIGMAALLLLVFTACDKDDSEPTKPFMGEYYVTVAVTSFNEVTGTMVAVLSATGEGTELGTSTWESNTTVHNTFSSPPWYQEGTQVFTAEDGSKLIGTFEGKTYPVGEAMGGSGHYLITEGTGKFKDVTGSGTYTWKPTANPENYLKFEGLLVNL
jgi:hypothetical protein